MLTWAWPESITSKTQIAELATVEHGLLIGVLEWIGVAVGTRKVFEVSTVPGNLTSAEIVRSVAGPVTTSFVAATVKKYGLEKDFEAGFSGLGMSTRQPDEEFLQTCPVHVGKILTL